MALGSLISIKKKLSEKNLSWVADLGWLVAVIGMYLLSLYLVIGQKQRRPFRIHCAQASVLGKVGHNQHLVVAEFARIGKYGIMDFIR